MYVCVLVFLLFKEKPLDTALLVILMFVIPMQTANLSIFIEG